MTDTLDITRRQGQRPPHAWETEWTQERVDTLTRMYTEGFSQRQIADELGISRGSVAGKISRLGLSGRSTAGPVTRFRRSQRSTKACRAAPEIVAPAPIEGRLTFAELDRCKCHFPYGDGPFLFCGETTAGDSYCAAHHRVAYQVAA